jgi:hypothetical protein
MISNPYDGYQIFSFLVLPMNSAEWIIGSGSGLWNGCTSLRCPKRFFFFSLYKFGIRLGTYLDLAIWAFLCFKFCSLFQQTIPTTTTTTAPTTETIIIHVLEGTDSGSHSQEVRL